MRIYKCDRCGEVVEKVQVVFFPGSGEKLDLCPDCDKEYSAIYASLLTKLEKELAEWLTTKVTKCSS